MNNNLFFRGVNRIFRLFGLNVVITSRAVADMHLVFTDNYLASTGWLRSYREKRSIDSVGNPIPWITYPAMEFLEPRIPRTACVFEYGSGFSTLWWEKRVQCVHSVDHDKSWHEVVKTKTASNNTRLLHYSLSDGAAYSEAILAQDAIYDIVVIDGRDRVGCTKNALPKLGQNGIIIFDNTEREEYAPAYSLLASNLFKRIDFHGFAPMYLQKTCTTIFYRTENILCI